MDELAYESINIDFSSSENQLNKEILRKAVIELI